MTQQHLMNGRPARRAAKVLGTLAVAACLTLPTEAQQNGRGRNNGQNSGGVIELPPGVRNVISIDAHNILIAEVESSTGEGSEYVPLAVRHVYSGGIAKIFGGTVIPTEQFVSPAFNKQGGMGNNGFQGPQTAFNGNGGNGFGNNGFGNNGNGNGGFGSFGNQTVTGPDGATGTIPNFGGFVGNGQYAPQNFAPQSFAPQNYMPQSTFNGRQARFSVNTGNRHLNQVLGLLDRPLPQVEVGTGSGSTNTTSTTSR